MVKKQFTPFQGNLVFDIEDIDGNPVEVSTLSDIKVLISVNSLTMLQFQKTAADGWIAWIVGDTTTSIKCPVTAEQTDGWRGLVVAQLESVEDDNSTFTLLSPLFLAVKSGLSTSNSPVVNPITFTPAFSCDATQQLVFDCAVTAPAANYIIEIKIEDEWKRLYDGYLEKVDGSEQTYTVTVPLGKQIAAGEYTMRVKNDITGATSAELPFYLPDCTEGAGVRRWRDGAWWMPWTYPYGG